MRRSLRRSRRRRSGLRRSRRRTLTLLLPRIEFGLLVLLVLRILLHRRRRSHQRMSALRHWRMRDLRSPGARNVG